jgi:hypothetical protein
MYQLPTLQNDSLYLLIHVLAAHGMGMDVSLLSKVYERAPEGSGLYNFCCGVLSTAAREYGISVSCLFDMAAAGLISWDFLHDTLDTVASVIPTWDVGRVLCPLTVDFKFPYSMWEPWIRTDDRSEGADCTIQNGLETKEQPLKS